MLRPFRALVAWMVLVALPLQGYAAATLAFCNPARASGAMVQQSDDVRTVHASDETRHHAASAAHSQTGKSGHAVTHGKCSVCASCCSGAAPASIGHIASAPPALGTEPFSKQQQDVPDDYSARLERPPRLTLA